MLGYAPKRKGDHVSHIKLDAAAHALPDFWKSQIIARSGNYNIKILKMDGQEYPAEQHDYDEALIVISGTMYLLVGESSIAVSQGEMFMAHAGVAHAVGKGSCGTLMIIDPVGQ